MGIVSVAGGTSAHKGQVGTLQATGLLFRLLAHAWCLPSPCELH